MCCQAQPPHGPAWRQRGITRLGDASAIAVISHSTLRPTGLSRLTYTRSPGMPPGTSSRTSDTFAVAAPERSMPGERHELLGWRASGG